MKISLRGQSIISNSTIQIPGSKSETNRLLALRALYPNIELQNISDSDDSKAMIAALENDSEVIDVGHAGTTMRFLTAYYAFQHGRSVTITGSQRMKQRPIKILVDALRSLGADITYLENEGFPPLKITGRKPAGNAVTINSNVSSQYISALLLTAPKFANGLQITLEGEVTSMPYINMTLDMMSQIGIKSMFLGNKITILPTLSITGCSFSIESDWSSASYFYSIIALSPIGTSVTLSRFKRHSFQGDIALVEIYKDFGVETTFENDCIVLTKSADCQLSIVNYQLNQTPDLAQTIAVTAFGLGLGCELSGLETLKIKETDRLAALKNEFEKLGANVSTTNDSISIAPSAVIKPNVTISTYDDHRMAMAFAPLALKVPVTIENPGVVSKSYPDFWKALRILGFKFE